VVINDATRPARSGVIVELTFKKMKATVIREAMEKMFFRHALSAEKIINIALDLSGRNSSVLVLLYAVDCIRQLGDM
jgi:hypothetical protein